METEYQRRQLDINNNQYINKTPKYEIRCSTDQLPNVYRSHTDKCCLAIFLSFGMIFVLNFLYGASVGSTTKLLAPYDPEGQRCGIGKLKEYPYIYTNTPRLNFEKMINVCVKKCPSKNGEAIQCSTNSKITSCSSLRSYKSFSLLRRQIGRAHV